VNEAQQADRRILSAIDAGSATGGKTGRFWTIDPVDGTSGFIRHQQFAVCLALIVDGAVELGVIGCPNLGPEPAAIGEEVVPNGKGVLMVAVRGEGSWSVSSADLPCFDCVSFLLLASAPRAAPGSLAPALLLLASSSGPSANPSAPSTRPTTPSSRSPPRPPPPTP
jgi:hypothetical protein